MLTHSLIGHRHLRLWFRVLQPKPLPKIDGGRQRHHGPRAALRQGLRARPLTPSVGTRPLRNQTLLPWEVQQDRRSLSAWIDAQAKLKPGPQDSRPTSKQVAFAERLARIKRRAVPDECFRDKGLMSKWIDGNK